jgi:hypothetical protein
LSIHGAATPARFRFRARFRILAADVGKHRVFLASGGMPRDRNLLGALGRVTSGAEAEAGAEAG